MPNHVTNKLLFHPCTEKRFNEILLFPRDKIIRMAGNSIPVKLLEGVFYQILLGNKPKLFERYY